MRRNEATHHAPGMDQKRRSVLPDRHSHTKRRAANNQVAAPNAMASLNWRSVSNVGAEPKKGEPNQGAEGMKKQHAEKRDHAW